MRGGDQLALGSGGGSEMADFFTAGWNLDPSRSADSTGQARRQAVEHALAKLGPSDDLWVLGNAFETTTSAEDAGKILSCTAARCHLLTGDSDPLSPEYRSLWDSVDLAAEQVIDGQLIIMSHFPMMAWHGAASDASVAQPDGVSRLNSLHVFGEGRDGFTGWWRAVCVDWSTHGETFLTLDQVRHRSQDNHFATPWLEAVHPKRRRYTSCDLCSGCIDRANRDGGYHWVKDKLVTFRGSLVLYRIAPFPDQGLTGFATSNREICADCLGVALQYFDLREGVHYAFAPGVTLQVIDRSAVHTAAHKGRQA